MWSGPRPQVSSALVTVMYHLVGRVVSLQLLVVGVLDEDGLTPDDWRDGGVVVHHGLCRLLRVHLQKSLRSQHKTPPQHFTRFPLAD